MKNKLFTGLTLVAVLSMSGCQQVNDMVSSNTTTNSNATANNTVANSNTTANSNANVGLTANSNANADSPVSNKPADNTSKPEEARLETPSNEKLQAMVKEVTLDFNDAVQREDFTDFRNKASKAWQNLDSAEKLKTNFGSFIRFKDEQQKITDSLKDIDAEFTGDPSRSQKYGYDYLEVKGLYRSSPRNLKFTVAYIPEGKEWKLAAVNFDNR